MFTFHYSNSDDTHALIKLWSNKLVVHCVITGKTCRDSRLRGLLPCLVWTWSLFNVHSAHCYPCYPPAGPPSYMWKKISTDQVQSNKINAFESVGISAKTTNGWIWNWDKIPFFLYMWEFIVFLMCICKTKQSSVAMLLCDCSYFWHVIHRLIQKTVCRRW